MNWSKIRWNICSIQFTSTKTKSLNSSFTIKYCSFWWHISAHEPELNNWKSTETLQEHKTFFFMLLIEHKAKLLLWNEKLEVTCNIKHDDCGKENRQTWSIEQNLLKSSPTTNWYLKLKVFLNIVKRACPGFGLV